MCGLFGYDLMSGVKIPVSLRVCTAILAEAMSARGEDAWGFMIEPTEHAPIRVEKGIGSVVNAKPARSLGQWHSVAGHTRYGTTGKNTVRNAHPFTVGPITGMHNGIVYNDFSLCKEYKRFDIQVDSEHIFYHLAEGKSTNDIKAYGAIVWRDERVPSTTHICKFNDGILSVARITKSGRQIGVIWASTEAAISDAAALGGFGCEFVEIKPNRVYAIKDGDVWNTTRKLKFDRHVVATTATSTATSGRYPYSTKVDHGYVDDEDGTYKYSTNGYTTWQPTKSGWKPSTSGLWHQSDWMKCDSCDEYGERCECEDCYCNHCVHRITELAEEEANTEAQRQLDEERANDADKEEDGANVTTQIDFNQPMLPAPSPVPVAV